MSHGIAAWQKRFFAQPKVFEVYVRDESTGNFYATEEGADIEVAWRRARKERARVVFHYLHDDELSRDRWHDQPASALLEGQAGKVPASDSVPGPTPPGKP